MRAIKRTRNSWLLVLFLGVIAGTQAWAQTANDLATQVQERGVIQALRLESNELVIDGVVFRVAYDARVEIRGSYGAFSMLQTGMKVEFSYRDFDIDTREIFELEQLPDNTEMESS